MYRKITFKYNEKHNCMNLSDLFINQAKELIRPSAFMSNITPAQEIEESS